jgi:hypothetical protein
VVDVSQPLDGRTVEEVVVPPEAGRCGAAGRRARARRTRPLPGRARHAEGRCTRGRGRRLAVLDTGTACGRLMSACPKRHSGLTPRRLTGRSKVHGMPSSTQRTHRSPPGVRLHLDPFRWHLSHARLGQIAPPAGDSPSRACACYHCLSSTASQGDRSWLEVWVRRIGVGGGCGG